MIRPNIMIRRNTRRNILKTVRSIKARRLLVIIIIIVTKMVLMIKRKYQ